jgi:hypothetical protein
MTILGIDRDQSKKPLEHVACFSVAIAALFVAAVGVQWLMTLIP